MLLHFNFKNYKSFRDESILDLTATPISEYEKHVIVEGGEEILPVAAIFGANASGKSNIIEAFRYMNDYVLDSLNYGGNLSKKEKNNFPAPSTFVLDPNTKNTEALFEVYFTIPNDPKEKTYNYGFTVNHQGIKEEWLNQKAKTAKKYTKIFYRNDNELDMSGLPVKIQENLKIALDNKTLLVSLGAKLKVEKLKFVRDWFMAIVFADFGRPIESFILSSYLPQNFSTDENVRKKVVNYFSSFDSSIVDFKVEIIKDTDKEDVVKVDAVHKTVDGSGYETIPLHNESAGTLKMFALYPWLNEVLTSGGVLVVDELNAKLHPLLVRVFIQTFLNKEINSNHAQLIFTSHDTWQLNSNILRRDEIWFTERQDNGISQLYSLADFTDQDGVKIRKDENYEKNYLLGKYGAIPTLKYFDLFKE